MKESKMMIRVLSIALVGAGLASIAAGQGSSVLAEESLNCVAGEWIQPAECIEAHVDHKSNDHDTSQQSGCKIVSGNCQTQGSGCDAGPKFNNAVPGKCQAYLGGSDVYRCSENFQKTAVTLTKVTGACDTVNGDCGCKYSSAMPVESKNVEVCNCKGEKV